MKDKKIIFILSASVKKDKDNKWISTGLDKEDFGLGAPGGKLRVTAGAYLYFDDNNYMLMVSGGRGWDIKNDEKTRPDLSEIMKQELIKIGVPESKILKENKSNKTFEQLSALKDYIKKYFLLHVIIISSDFHLPRVRAMIEFDDELDKFLKSNIIELVSAEEICLKYDFKKWKNIIDSAYESKEMKKIIDLEKKGICDIKEGKYKFN